MRWRRSRCVELALVATWVWAGAERDARAQACCVAPGANGMARLAAYENALAGIDARATSATGSFDAHGHFRRLPSGVQDLALEQSLFTTVRFLARGQATLTVPFEETVRAADTVSSSGGGVGDIRGGVRWDLLDVLALTGGLIAPTGTAPERAGDPLGAGATGTGTTQVWAGFALETTSGPWLAGANGTVTYRADRDVGPVRSSLAPLFSGNVVGAYAWRSGVALSFAPSWEIEGRAGANGVVVAGSQRRVLRFTTALEVELGWHSRLIGSVFTVPPVPAVTAGDQASIGASAAWLVSWSGDSRNRE